MNWRLCFQLDKEHEGSGQFPQGCVELSQCRFSPFQWVSTSLLQPRDGGCLRSELTQTGRVAEVGWGDRLPGGAFWHPVQTPDGHSKDQMARLILDSVRLREPEQKKRETQKLQERDLLHREAQVRKDHDGGSRTGVGEEKTGAPGAQDVGDPPLLLPRALGPDRCEGRLRASTTRILHKHELEGLLAGTWVLPFVFSSLPSVPPPLLSHTHGAAVAGSEIADSGSREGPEGPAQWFSKWSSDRPHGAPRDEQVCGWSKHTCA